MLAIPLREPLMAEFDPYLSWLGIRDPRRPPTHYRLLGLELYENDPDVIQNAADRLMSHVRTFQASKFSEHSQKILNELAQAKLCLLNDKKRAEYDARLQAEEAARAQEAARAEEAARPAPPKAPAVPAPATARPKPSRPVANVQPVEAEAAEPPARGLSPALLAAAGAALLLVLAGVGWFVMRPGRDAAVVANAPQVDPSEAEDPSKLSPAIEPAEVEKALAKVATPEVPKKQPDSAKKPDPAQKPPPELPPLLTRFDDPPTYVATLGERMLAATGDTISLWNFDGGANLAGAASLEKLIRAAAVAPSRSQVLFGGAGRLRRWDFNEDQLVDTFEVGSAEILSLGWSRNERLAIAGGSNGAVMIWDVAAGEELVRLAELEDPVEAVALDRRGARAAAGTRAGELRLWDVASGRELAALTHPENPRDQRRIVAAQFSRDGERLIYALSDGTARILNVESQEEIHRLKGHQGALSAVEYYAGDQRVLTGSVDGTLRVWNPESGRQLAELATGGPVRACCVDPLGKTAWCGMSDGAFRAYALPDPPSFQEPVERPERPAVGLALSWKGPPGEIRDLAFSPDEKRVAVASSDENVWLWELQVKEGERVVGSPIRLGPHHGGPASLAFLNDHELAAGGSDGALRIWQLRDRTGPAITAHAGPIRQLVRSPSGKLLLSADEERQAKLWSFPGGKLEKELKSPARGDRWDLSDDGARVVSGGFDRMLRWWNASEGREARRVAVRSWIASAVLIPGGGLVATGGSDGLIRIWNAEQEQFRLAGHKGPVWSIAPTADGALLISASQDKTVRVWDVASGRETALFRHDSPVLRAAVGASGELAVSVDRSGTLCLWGLPTVERLDPDPAAQVAGRTRMTVPDKAVVTAGETQIRAQYKAEYAKRNPAEKAALALRLLERGQTVEANDPLRYPLLSEAREQASGAGDVALTLSAIEATNKLYEVDALDIASETLTEIVRTLKTPEAHLLLVRELLKRADLALAEDRHDLALKFVAVATRTAVKLNSPLLTGFANARDRQVRVAKNDYDRLKKQVDRLTEDPSDPDANLQLGKYEALTTGDWDRGLPRIALSNDVVLARLALRELSQPQDATMLREMGRAWASAAADETKLPWKTAMQIRAYERYREALADSNEDVRRLIEEQLADLAKQLAPRASVFLSSMPEAEVSVGYGTFGKSGTLGYASPGGDRIRIRGQLSPNGLSMYPPVAGASHVAYGAFGQFRTFQGSVGIADTASIPRVAAPLVFVVKGDGEERWRSEPIRGRGQTQDFLVDVTGVEKLVLEVECADDNAGCQAVWLEPRLWPFKLR